MSVFIRKLFFSNTQHLVQLRSALKRLDSLRDKKNLLKSILFSNKKVPVAKPLPVILTLSFGFGFKKSNTDVPKKMSSPVTEKSAELIEILRHADQLYDENHYQEAIDLMEKYPNEVVDITWRLGRAYYSMSKAADKKKKDELIRKSFTFCEKALKMDDKDFACHKWYAILLDAQSELDGIKVRAGNLEAVKKHMIAAVELNPEDATSRYMLGAFAFGIADMAWYERKILQTLFTSPPTGTYEEALEHFLKAEEIKPDFYSLNKMMTGKCYLRLKNNEKAKHFLTLASNIQVVTEDDKKCKEEADQLLKKL